METKNIQESKVNFETAVLAKELGFDEICYYHFGIDGEEFASRLPDGSKNSNWAKCTARPTLAHLQAWLRENYDIHVFAQHETIDDAECAYVWVIKTYVPEGIEGTRKKKEHEFWEWYDSFSKEMMWWQSYDDALSNGLKKGLAKLKAILEKQKTVKTQL